MITPYDLPAQSQVVDFYEEIPFQDIATMALKRDKDYSDYLNKIDAYSTNIANIEAVSDKDKAYLKGVKDTLDTTVNEAVKSGVDFADTYQARQFLNTIQSKVDPTALKNIMGTTANYKAYREQIEKLGKDYDPFMDESQDVSNWDSTKNRTWTGRATGYISAEKELENIIDKIQPTMFDDENNGYYKYGVRRQDVERIAAENAESFATTQAGKYQVNRYRKMYGVDPKISDIQIAQEIIRDRGESKIGYKREGYYDLDRRLRAAKMQGEVGIPNYLNSLHKEIEDNKSKGLGSKGSIAQGTLSLFANQDKDGYVKFEDITRLHGGKIISNPADTTHLKDKYIEAAELIDTYNNYRQKRINASGNKTDVEPYTSPQGVLMYPLGVNTKTNEEEYLKNQRVEEQARKLLLTKFGIDVDNESNVKLVKDNAREQLSVSFGTMPGIPNVKAKILGDRNNVQFSDQGGLVADAEFLYEGSMKSLKRAYDNKFKESKMEVYKEASVNPEKAGWVEETRTDNKGNTKTVCIKKGYLPLGNTVLDDNQVDRYNMEKLWGISRSPAQNLQKAELEYGAGLTEDNYLDEYNYRY